MPVQFQVVVFAFIAAFVLFQLYNVLGKRVGRQPQEDAKIAPPGPAQAETPKVAAIDPVASMAAVENEGLEAVAAEVRERLRRVVEAL